MAEIEETSTETVVVTPSPLLLVNRLIYYILDVIEVLLAVRFIIRLLALNPLSGFVQFVYSVTSPLVTPFQGIVGNVVTSNSTIEWAALLAMAVYALVAYVIARFFIIIAGR